MTAMGPGLRRDDNRLGIAMHTLGLPRAECPEQVGFSAARLAHAVMVIRGDVAKV